MLIRSSFTSEVQCRLGIDTGISISCIVELLLVELETVQDLRQLPDASTKDNMASQLSKKEAAITKEWLCKLAIMVICIVKRLDE